MEQTPRPPRSLGNRAIWIAGGVLAAALIVLAMVGLGTPQDDAAYAPDTPEAALQAYFRAWHDGDTETAWAALTERARARLPEEEYYAAGGWYDDDTPVRIWIADRTDRDDSVVLEIGIEVTWEGLLGPDRETHEQRVTMRREGGAWKVDTPMMGPYGW